MPERLALTAAALLLTTLPALSQNRPPATPLITHDPYFSASGPAPIKLTDSPTRHWTGHPQPLTGLVRIDGNATFQHHGQPTPAAFPPWTRPPSHLTPTHTRYTFTASGIDPHPHLLHSGLPGRPRPPLPPRNLSHLDRPIHRQRTPHQVTVLLDASPALATGATTASQSPPPATELEPREVLSVGTRDQNILSHSGDDLRIDWGYFHLVHPQRRTQQVHDISQSPQRPRHLRQRPAPSPLSDDISKAPPPPAAPQPPASRRLTLPMGAVAAQPISRHHPGQLHRGPTPSSSSTRTFRPYWQREQQTRSRPCSTKPNRQYRSAGSPWPVKFDTRPHRRPHPHPPAPTTPGSAPWPTARPSPPTSS